MKKIKYCIILGNSEPNTSTFQLNNVYFCGIWFCINLSQSSEIISVEYFYCFDGQALANSQTPTQPLTNSPPLDREWQKEGLKSFWAEIKMGRCLPSTEKN